MPSTYRHPYTEGDLLISSCGSAMAYIDCYRAIRATSKMVTVRRIEARVTEIIGAERAAVTASPNEFRGDEQRRRVRCDEDGWHTLLSSWERAILWDGAPRVAARLVWFRGSSRRTVSGGLNWEL